MVVTTVDEKKMDWPKLQLGWPVTLLTADTPRSAAQTTSLSSVSRSKSAQAEK